MVDARSDDVECIVHVCKRKQGFAIHVGVCDVDGVEGGRVVVEYAKEVIVGAEEVIGRVLWSAGLRGDVQGGEVGEGAEEGCLGSRGLVARGWRSGAVITAKEGG